MITLEQKTKKIFTAVHNFYDDVFKIWTFEKKNVTIQNLFSAVMAVVFKLTFFQHIIFFNANLRQNFDLGKIDIKIKKLNLFSI